MNFARFFTDHPVFASVLSILIIIIGSLAILTLPIERHPQIAPPTVVVSTTYPGASGETVAKTVATPLEQEINGVEDMLYMSSQATNDGALRLTITFELGTDLDKAQVLVQNRVALAEPRLPEEVRRMGISVRKSSPDLSLVVNIISPDQRYDQIYLSNYALIHVREALARLPGVGDIALFGGRDYSMRVWLDPESLASRELTAMDVVRAIREQNVQVAAGTLGEPPIPGSTDLQLTVNTMGRLTEAEQFGKIIVKTGTEGQVTYVRDIARIELGAASYASNLYLGSQPTVGIIIFQRPGSNALETKQAVMETMERLAKDFPPGIAYRVVYDTTTFIEESVKSVVKVLFEAVLIVLVVVLVFLQNWRATLIPMLAVPVSLIGTFAVLAALGFSLNTLTLAAMVLAIGIVVDDAIVVVENVERNLEAGLPRREATLKAMGEVSGAIIAMALVLGAVFIPTAFISGVTGQFYQQFALTIAAATIISAINSLTLSPALSAIFLKSPDEKKDFLQCWLDRLFGWFFKGFNWVFGWFWTKYTLLIRRLVRMSVLMLGIYGGLLGLTYLGFTQVPTGFIPQEDQGYLIVFAQLPDAASLERTDAVLRRANEIILDTKGILSTNAVAGWSVIMRGNQPNVGTIFVILDPFSERTEENLGANAIAETLQQRLGEIQEAFIGVFPPPSVRGIGNLGGFKMEIQDQGGRGLHALQDAVEQVIITGNQTPELSGLFTTFRANVPQIYLDIDRTQARSMGVPLSNVFDTLQVYLGSLYVNDFNLFGRTFRVVAQADGAFRDQPEDIYLLKTRNVSGEMVPLGALVDIQETTGPDKVNRYNLFPAAEVNGDAMPGISSGQAISLMEAIAERELPRGFGFEWTELTYQQILAGNTAVYIFPLCVLFVFLVLAAQYESWSLPLAVILIVPMCLLSAIMGIWFMGMDNNIFTQIGFIVLIGLASKNAILIVEFAKQLQDKQGLNRYKAAVESSRLRLRPILMTSFAFVFGVLPLVIAEGAGAESRELLGVAVLSGMLGVTFFGLVFTPIFYVVVRTFVERRQVRVRAEMPKPVHKEGDIEPLTPGNSD
ncbi:efflux RND transporter permease subunit [Nitrosococcus oceani]|uniref:efflux RND transporter permease subunit n=1 Tax=Nitrosococcus oceani TaxID=1229 RepID=UPI0004E94AC8|nr:multidrug efflux RND transporter permease subunit [Nitrosococcus oceani]KFI22464.1 RND transporter [Nitrosococcus oceani]